MFLIHIIYFDSIRKINSENFIQKNKMITKITTRKYFLVFISKIHEVLFLEASVQNFKQKPLKSVHNTFPPL